MVSWAHRGVHTSKVGPTFNTATSECYGLGYYTSRIGRQYWLNVLSAVRREGATAVYLYPWLGLSHPQ